MIKDCPCCHGTNYEELVAVDNVPVSCATLFRNEREAAASDLCRMEITLCLMCSHIWNRAFQIESTTIYEGDYHSSVSQSEQAQDTQRSLAIELRKEVPIEGNTVLEIGCGDGFFLKELSSMGAICSGYEPSDTYYLAKGTSGVSLVNGYVDFTSTGPICQSTDIVIMRHVLEHLPDPVQVLSSIRNILFEDPPPSYLVLEVPNSAQLILDDLYFDFYNDHIQYFSITSLHKVLKGTGWIPIKTIPGGNEFIRVLAVNANCLELSPRRSISCPNSEDLIDMTLAFKNNYDFWITNLKSVIHSQIGVGSKVAVWGAGARGISLLCRLHQFGLKITYVVDSDIGKHGKYLPYSNIPVKSPDELKTEPVDCIIISSYTYFSEISQELEWFSSNGGQIMKIYPDPCII